MTDDKPKQVAVSLVVLEVLPNTKGIEPGWTFAGQIGGGELVYHSQRFPSKAAAMEKATEAMGIIRGVITKSGGKIKFASGWIDRVSKQ